MVGKSAMYRRRSLRSSLAGAAAIAAAATFPGAQSVSAEDAPLFRQVWQQQRRWESPRQAWQRQQQRRWESPRHTNTSAGCGLSRNSGSGAVEQSQHGWEDSAWQQVSLQSQRPVSIGLGRPRVLPAPRVGRWTPRPARCGF